jgi:hypothetical protein
MSNIPDNIRKMWEEAAKGKPNPWAVCHAKLGPEKDAKFERCVMHVKGEDGGKKSSNG